MKVPIESRSSKRPFGVSIIVLLLIANALLMAAIVYLLLIPENIELAQQIQNFTHNHELSVVLMVNIFVQMVIVAGLWKLKRWAWLLLMLYIGFSMISDMWAYYHLQDLRAISMTINVIIVFYINQREVKKAFSGKTLMGAKWTI